MHPRYFELLNFQHFMLYFFPALAFVLLFAAALGFVHFRRRKDAGDDGGDLHVFSGDIREGNQPFPLVLILVIGGTVVWGFGYIVVSGLLGRVI